MISLMAMVMPLVSMMQLKSAEECLPRNMWSSVLDISLSYASEKGLFVQIFTLSQIILAYMTAIPPMKTNLSQDSGVARNLVRGFCESFIGFKVPNHTQLLATIIFGEGGALRVQHWAES